MATNKICDVCGDPSKPVYLTCVAVDVVGAVDKEGPTSCVHELEACEPCWAKAMKDIFANVSEQLLRDIPIHRQIYRLNEEIGALTSDLRARVSERDVLPGGSSLWMDADRRVLGIEQALREKVGERAKLVATQ